MIEDVRAQVPAAHAYISRIVLSDVAVKMSETRVPAIFGRIINAGNRGVDEVRLTVSYYTGRGARRRMAYQESHSVIVTPIEFTGFIRPVQPFVPGENRDFGFELIAPAQIQQQSEPSLTVGSLVFAPQSKAPLPTLAIENPTLPSQPSGSPSARPATPTPVPSPRSRATPASTRQLAIRLTLAVPTHNRAATLGGTLASLAAQRLPEGVETECLVIDNNSSDRTPAVVEEAAARAPFAMRRVFDAPGSSFARNRAVDEAAGDFILFIDDDAIADADWAALMLAAIERRGLDAACGMVLPRWEVTPPRWLGARLHRALERQNRTTRPASTRQSRRCRVCRASRSRRVRSRVG